MIDLATLVRVEAVSQLMLLIPAIYSFAGVLRSNWHAGRARDLQAALDDAPPPPDEIGAARDRITRHEERARLLLELTKLLPFWAMLLLGAGLGLRLCIALGQITGLLPA